MKRLMAVLLVALLGANGALAQQNVECERHQIAGQAGRNHLWPPDRARRRFNSAPPVQPANPGHSWVRIITQGQAFAASSRGN